MSVRLKIALTIFFTGALTAIGVIATVLFAFQRFEQESIYQRADAFLHRVGTTYTGLLDQQQRHPGEFGDFLRSLVFFEPNSQLYLLDPNGNVLASSSARPLAPGYRVAMSPVLAAAGQQPMPYVMGDDPERPGERSDAVIAALALTRAVIRTDQPVAGYLYLVCQKPLLPEGGWQRVRSTFAKPALAAVVAVVLLATLLTAWITASVTRPLRRLTEAVATIERDGLVRRQTNGPVAEQVAVGVILAKLVPKCVDFTSGCESAAMEAAGDELAQRHTAQGAPRTQPMRIFATEAALCIHLALRAARDGAPWL
jgi:C4-dicarboxylate-specific signal transduction histidine kinase